MSKGKDCSKFFPSKGRTLHTFPVALQHTPLPLFLQSLPSGMSMIAVLPKVMEADLNDCQSPPQHFEGNSSLTVSPPFPPFHARECMSMSANCIHTDHDCCPAKCDGSSFQLASGDWKLAASRRSKISGGTFSPPPPQQHARHQPFSSIPLLYD